MGMFYEPRPISRCYKCNKKHYEDQMILLETKNFLYRKFICYPCKGIKKSKFEKMREAGYYPWESDLYDEREFWNG